MTNHNNVLKSRDITLPTKVCIVKAMVFPVVTYNCESWTLKKAEHQRTDAFELCFWRRLLRVPRTGRSSNQSVLRESTLILNGRTDAEVEATVFQSPNMNSQLIEKVLDAGNNWGQKEKRASEDETVGWHHRCNGYELGQTLGDGEELGVLACCSPRGHRVGHDCATGQQLLKA